MRALPALLMALVACSFDTTGNYLQTSDGATPDGIHAYDAVAMETDAAPSDAIVADAIPDSAPPAPDASIPDGAPPDAGPCSPLLRGCAPGEACYVFGAETQCVSLQPEPRPDGDSCILMSQCEAGTGCISSALASLCLAYCDYEAFPDVPDPEHCGSDRVCKGIPGNPTFGHCESELWD